MRKRTLVATALASFLAGIAFVIACGDSGSSPDARPDSLVRIPDAQAQITPMQVYRVEDRTSIDAGNNPDTGTYSVADCRDGDILLSGGCWVYSKNSTSRGEIYQYLHPLVAFGPPPKPPMGPADTNPNAYYCYYENRDVPKTDMVVVATAICYDVP